jgi:hypothetical protein
MSLGCTALMISSKRPSRVKERELRPPMALLTTGRESEYGTNTPQPVCVTLDS